MGEEIPYKRITIVWDSEVDLSKLPPQTVAWHNFWDNYQPPFEADEPVVIESPPENA